MKRATVFVLALLLVPAARADAKFSSARVCGPSNCREVDLTAERTFLPIVETAFSGGPAFTAKPPEASPWYRVRLCAGSCDSRHALTLKVLPTAEYEPTHPFVWPRDPRAEPGELLWKRKWPHRWLAEKALELGSYGYAGQYQQRPAPAEGGIFKRSWWRRYTEVPQLQDSARGTWPSRTPTAPTTSSASWGRDQADKYLLAQIRARLDFTATLAGVKSLHEWGEERFGNVGAILVEDAANGPAVIAALWRAIAGMIAVKPAGGKEARAHAITPQIESGNVYLPVGRIPAPSGYSEALADELIEECAAFPNGAYDDQVDALTQGLNRLARSSSRGKLRWGTVEYPRLRDR